MNIKTAKTTFGIALFSLLGLGLVAGTASADEDNARRGGMNACKADVERLCGDVEKGEGRIRACMKEHKDELSQGCQTQIEKRKARKGKKKGKKHRKEQRQAFKAACGEDVQNTCGDVEKGERKACVKANLSQFSQTCQDFVAERKEERKARKGKRKGKKGKGWKKNLSEEERAMAKQLRQEVKASCEADVQNFCSDAEGKRGVRQCLKSHESELSSTCTDAIAKAKAFKQSLKPGN